MTTNTKPNKQPKKVNVQNLVDTLARTAAFVATMVLASYGMRQLLKSLTDTVALTVTVVAVLGLLYIQTRKR